MERARSELRFRTWHTRRPVVGDVRAGLVGGRYRVLDELGSGAMGVVYRARDCERELEIAIKQLRNIDADAIYRFKNEFRNLANVNHENLLQLYDLVRDGEHWYLTMELVTGADLSSFVQGPAGARPATGTSPLSETRPPPRGDPPESQTTASTVEAGHVGLTDFADVSRHPERRPPCIRPHQLERLRSAFLQLVTGVHALHQHGILHRDLKPSNAMVDEHGRTIVLDFGIAAHVGDTRRGGAGTPAYMPPEQTNAGTLAPAADWYAVGTMMFELLAGSRPFTGPTAIVLELKRRDPAAPLRMVAPQAPADLAALCDSLLDQDPAKRPDFEHIESVLGGGPRGRRKRSRSSRPAPLVGRTPHLLALREALETSRDEPSIAFVHGPSGAGKTALLQQFSSELNQDGNALVLTGRCYERESVPYKAVDELVDAVAAHLRELPEDDVAAVVPDSAGQLPRLFPAVAGVPRIAALAESSSAADPHLARQSAFRALRHILAALSRRRPVCLHVDDVHWGDADSAALVAELLRPPDAPRVLFVASFRSDEGSRSRFVSQLRNSAARAIEIEVGPLSPEHSEELASRLLGPEAATPQLGMIARESAGSPFFIAELAHHLASGGDSGGDETSLDGALRARISSLAPPERRLLEVVSLARGPIAQGVAAAAAELAGSEGRVLAALRARNVLRTSGTRARDVVETYHDRIREAVVTELSAESRQRGHRRLADALVARPGSDLESIAGHFDGAGDRSLAGQYYRDAAANAAESLAFERATTLYELAIDRLQPSGDDERELFASLGQSLVNAGRGRAAADAFARAGEAATDDAESVRLHGLCATELLRSGDIDDGTEKMRKVLSRIRLWLPRSRWGALIQLLWWRARIALRGLAFDQVPAELIEPERRGRLDACWAASGALAMANYVVGTAFQARHLLDALAAGEPHHVARALAIEAVNRSLNGAPAQQAKVILNRAQNLADTLDDDPTQVWIHGSRSLAEYQYGHWRRSADESQRALALMRNLKGLSWERGSTQLYLSCAWFWLGELAAMSRRVPEYLESFEARGDLYGATNLSIGTPSVCWLVRDEPEHRRRISDDAAARWSHRDYHLQHYWRGLGDIYGQLYQSRPTDALATANSVYRQARRAFLLRCPAVRQEIRFFRSVAALAVAADRGITRGSLLRIAGRMARGLARERLPAPRALAELLIANSERVRGRDQPAADKLESAAEMLRVADMPVVAAYADRARAELIGGELGSELALAAEATIGRQGIANIPAFARLWL